MNAYLEMARPANVLLGMAGVLVGGLVAAGTGVAGHGWALLLGCVVVSTFMAAGNALNDLADREIDRVNHPRRPIPSGRVSPRQAAAFAAILWAVCIAASLALPFDAIVIALTAAFLMVAYDLGLKRAGFVGNVTIGLLVGMLFLFGGAVAGDPMPALVLFLLASLTTAAREVVKDIEDMVGDVGRDTLPRSIGAARARGVAAAMVVSAVALSPLPAVLRLLGTPYLYVVAVADGMFIYSISGFSDPGRASWLLKASMAVGLAAFVAGGMT